jgi:tripartite-type tricarboxylate transporter receptor subunit TctC
MFGTSYRTHTAVGISVIALLVGALAGCGDSGGDSGGGGGGASEFKRPVTMVIPFGPGVGSDQAGRLAAPVLEKELGVQFPVINVPGATGNTGMTKMLQSRPGEAAAIMPADTLATVVAGTSSFKLDEIKPVCRISNAPSSLWVNTKGKYKTWEALSKAAKEQPGKLTVATVGKGGIDDIQLGALAQKGFKFRAVPYAEGSERKASVLSGDSDAIYEQYGDVKDNVESGQFKPVLHFNTKKQEGLKGDYTLVSELGITDVIHQFRGLLASAEMPAGQLKAMSEACSKVESDPKFAEFAKTNLEFDGSFMNAAEFEKFIKSEAARMGELGKRYGVFDQ